MCFPVIFTNIATGIKNTDKKILEMCKVYKLTKLEIIKSVFFYSVLPYIYSAIISSIGIAWKASSAAEVLSMPKYSIGKYLFYAKANLEPTELFSWTIIIISLSYILETVFVKIGGRNVKIK
jgi:NitT/TauT family transport system permease protein